MKVVLTKKQQKKLMKANKHFGLTKSKKINKRLNELNAAVSLKDIESLKIPKLHPLTGNREGQFALTTKEPFRIIIKPVNNDFDINNYLTITEVKVIELDVDYH